MHKGLVTDQNIGLALINTVTFIFCTLPESELFLPIILNFVCAIVAGLLSSLLFLGITKKHWWRKNKKKFNDFSDVFEGNLLRYIFSSALSICLSFSELLMVSSYINLGQMVELIFLGFLFFNTLLSLQLIENFQRSEKKFIKKLALLLYLNVWKSTSNLLKKYL